MRRSERFFSERLFLFGWLLELPARTDSGDFSPELQEMGASGDVKPAIVRIAERHVGGANARLRFAIGLREMNPAQRPAFRGSDLNAAGSSTAGCVEVALRIDTHPIGSVIDKYLAIGDGIV